MQAPVAKKIPYEIEKHGHVRVDNYYWMNNRENSDVIDYLNLENDYTTNRLLHTQGFQDNLFKEIVGRMKQDDSSVPYKYEGDFFYSRYEEGKEHPIYCRKRGSLDRAEEILIDVNKLAERQAYCQVAGYSLDPSKQIMAFGIDYVSRRIYTIYFRNLSTGEVWDATIENTTGDAHWSECGKYLFYTSKDVQTLRPDKIMRYEIATGMSENVFHETDDTFTTSVYKTLSKKWIVISCNSTVSTEYRFLAMDNPTGDFQVFLPRERDHEYFVGDFNGEFFIQTNYNALNFRLMKGKIGQVKEDWEEVIPHREETLLEDFLLYNDFMVLQERTNGLTQLRVIDQKNGEDHYINFGEPTYTAYLGLNLDRSSNILRFGYTSLTTPSSVIDYNMSTKTKDVKKEQEVIGSFSKSDYVSERKWATARDGVKVPVSIVYHKDTPKSADTPLLLYAYGSYGYSMDAYFSSVRLSLLDRGFIYAIAHIRGGEDLGRAWYENGKLLKKLNTFHDFIDAGKFLVDENYTSSQKLFAMGGSAGGMLMGGIMNMEPSLFKGIVAQVPFVDCVTTMLDDSIPLTTGEYDEWGNPNEKEYYEYMLSYSPYDQVEKKDYPNTLVTSGLHDSQVQYWEPTKWVAKLRELKTDNNLLLLYTNMEAGHGGASGRFEIHKETALEFAFLLDLAGITE